MTTQMKNGYSHQTLHTAILFLFLVMLCACQDCFRFYRPDTFEVWTVPLGAGLCNISAASACPSTLVGFYSNSSLGIFNFNYCDSNRKIRTTDLTESFASGANGTILLYFSSMSYVPMADTKDFAFLELAGDSETVNASLYQPFSITTTSGSGSTVNYMNVRPGDIVYHNTATKTVFNVLMSLIFVGVQVLTSWKPEFLPAASIAFSIFYAAMSLAVYNWEFLFWTMLSSVAGALLLGAGFFFAFHKLFSRDGFTSSLLSIIVNAAVMMLFIYIPAEGSSAGIFILIGVGLNVLLAIILWIYGCRKENPKLDKKMRVKCSAFLGFSCLSSAVVIYSISLSITYSIKRLIHSPENYPFAKNNESNREVVQGFLSLLAILIFGIKNSADARKLYNSYSGDTATGTQSLGTSPADYLSLPTKDA